MIVWEGCWSLWNHRNKHLHSNNTLNEYHSMADIDDQIRTEFQKEIPQCVPNQYAVYFEDRDLEKVLALSNFHRRAWMRMVSRARKAGATRTTSQQTLITSYLPTQTTDSTRDATPEAQPPLRNANQSRHQSTVIHPLAKSRRRRYKDKNQTTIRSFFQALPEARPRTQSTTIDDEPPDSDDPRSDTDTTTTIPRKRPVQSSFPQIWKKQRKS